MNNLSSIFICIKMQRRNKDRSSVGDMIRGDDGIRGQMMRKGQAPVDHMRENRMKIKDTEFKIREMKELAAQEDNQLYKLPQFRDVEARVYLSPRESDGGATSRARATSLDASNFLAKGKAEQVRAELTEQRKEKRAELEAELEAARALIGETSQRRAPVPRIEELTTAVAPRRQADFIGENKVKAQLLLPPKPSQKEAPVKHESYGRVPDYIEQRKAKQMAEEEERRRNAPDPNCPRGMKLMPETERISTLEILSASREECLKQLQKMPFVVETATLKKKKETLETKLQEVEQAIELFQKPKVYIAIDS